jgi:hypothetical protein
LELDFLALCHSFSIAENRSWSAKHLATKTVDQKAKLERITFANYP